MTETLYYRLLADAVLVLHAGFVVFVVFGLALVLVGRARCWHWVRNPWFRYLHLVAIAVVVAQAWLGVACPLTTLELALRERAGGARYAGDLIAHWVQLVLYWRAPWWMFAAVYTVFGVAVLWAWIAVRPRRFGAGPGDRAT